MVTHPNSSRDIADDAPGRATPFGEWLDADRTLLILPAISVIFGLLFIAWQTCTGSSDISVLARSAAVGFHFLVTLFLLFRSPKVIGSMQDPDAERRTVRFQYAWMILLASWLFLYMTMSGREVACLANPALRDSPYWTPFLNLFNNLASVALMMAYVALLPGITVASYAASWTRWIFLPILAVLSELGLTVILDMYGDRFFYICRTALDATSWGAGLFSGVVLAMLIGRLAQAVDVRPKLVASFYLYAVIQAAWPAVAGQATSAVVFLSAALVLKTLFFLHAKWIIEAAALRNPALHALRHQSLGTPA